MAVILTVRWIINRYRDLVQLCRQRAEVKFKMMKGVGIMGI